MATPEDAKLKAALTYNAAADSYDHPANAFWERFGRRTVERLDLQAGERILDVCCGSGASALAAAERVGPSGSVLAVDLAEHLVDLARRNAATRRQRNIEFRVGDMLALRPEDERFDAVVCVFGIFFVPDMPAATRELWSLVKPGGRLALTTWGRELFEPFNSFFWNAVREVRPDLYKGFNPWDRICDARSLAGMMAQAGIARVETLEEAGVHAIDSAEDCWTLALGSGFRGTIEQLDVADRERVRTSALAEVREAGVKELVTNVVYAVAAKERSVV